MLHYFTNLFAPTRFSTAALQDPGSLCLIITFLLCTDLHEIIFIAALVGLHGIFPDILRMVLDRDTAKHIYWALYLNSKTDIIWMIAPAIALSFFRSVRLSILSQRLTQAETRLTKLERKQAVAAARLRRQRSNLTPEEVLNLEAILNSIPY